MKTVDAVKMFAMGIIVALLCVIAFQAPTDVRAADRASSGGITAVTQRFGNDGKFAGMILIDTQSKKLAYYLFDDMKFAFCTARDFSYDIMQKSLKFERKGYSVKDAEKKYKKDIKTN